MIQWENQYKQILTKLCISCPDDYFAPHSSDLPHVGCCSYSPAFSLFEVFKMIHNDGEEFFWEQIYHNKQRDLYDYKIVVRANVSDRFDQLGRTSLSKVEEEDLRLQFSVCQFFVDGKGCGLNPSFKNETCRSFICSAVENQLNVDQKKDLNQWVREIRLEVAQFNSIHEKILEKKGWSFIHHMKEIVDYLRELNRNG